MVLVRQIYFMIFLTLVPPTEQSCHQTLAAGPDRLVPGQVTSTLHRHLHHLTDQGVLVHPDTIPHQAHQEQHQQHLEWGQVSKK